MSKRWVLGLWLVCAAAAAPNPADWVPARWPWTDPKSLDLLESGPVNCLLLRDYPAAFVSAASARGVVTLAVVKPGADVEAEARRALAAKVDGVVLEGEFPDAVVAAVRASGLPVIEL